MRITTLTIPITDYEILLGVKKKRHGKGKINAPGGHVEIGETTEAAAMRELQEETGGKEDKAKGIRALEYKKVGEISYFQIDNPDWNQNMHIYLVTKWSGIPEETDEMSFEWFKKQNIPYQNMWDNDKYWLPQVLLGKKVRGSIIRNAESTLENTLEFYD